MVKENCPHAFRKRGDVSIHCEILAQETRADYCGHQYLCRQTRRWEATKQAADCPLRMKNKGKEVER